MSFAELPLAPLNLDRDSTAPFQRGGPVETLLVVQSAVGSRRWLRGSWAFDRATTGHQRTRIAVAVDRNGTASYPMVHSCPDARGLISHGPPSHLFADYYIRKWGILQYFAIIPICIRYRLKHTRETGVDAKE